MKKLISFVLSVTMVVTIAVTGFAATYKLGDVDKNGSVTPADARQVLRYAAMLDVYDDEQKLLSDFSGDGELTPADARQVLRVAAGLDISDAVVTSGGIELGDSIGMTLTEFIKKYGTTETVGTSDGTKKYKNDEIAVVSDPEMISGDKVSSVTVTGDGYEVKGVKVGMTLDSAKSLLAGEKWSVKSKNDSLWVFQKDGLLIKLAYDENSNIEKVILCLSHSLVSDSDDETDDTPDIGEDADYLDFSELPEAAQCFLNGQFGLDGSIFSNDTQTDVSMYTDSININMSAKIDMGEDGIVDMTILMLDEGDPECNIYMLNNDNKKYVELSDSTLAMLNTLTGGSLNLKKSDFVIDFNLNDPATVKITTETKVEDGKNYTVYKAKGENNITNLYFENDDILKIIITDFYGNAVTVIDVDELMYPVSENSFSYKGYKSTGITSLFDIKMK